LGGIGLSLKEGDEIEKVETEGTQKEIIRPERGIGGISITMEKKQPNRQGNQP